MDDLEQESGLVAPAALHRRSGLTRRRLLRAALAGAAVPAAGVVAQDDHGHDPATPGSGGGGGRGQATPVASAVGPSVITDAAVETWNEPWVWRPGDWPGQQLEMNVVENENPGAIVGYGNISATLFSYNGTTPGPTIRMRGDETLLLRLRNLLGQNYGSTYIGPYPDPPSLPNWVSASDVNAKAEQQGQLRYDFCLGEHTNGVHSARVTNLHSHGLHVRPGTNPDGTHSDNVILRLIDPDDLEKRQAEADHPACQWLQDPEQISYLRDDEITGVADYEFRIGNVQARRQEEQGLPRQPHPPGTHWYHPHTHGSTHNQVSSGMAGFLVIEGDVDEAINRKLTGTPRPDPQMRTGSWDYMERLMLFQRVFIGSTDPDAPTRDLKSGGVASPAVNGDQTPMVITMRPGAIERWRVLNGSVDGRGFGRFMVVKGQYDVEESASQGGGITSTLVKLRDAQSGEFTPATWAEVSADKQQLYQLAFDGVNLIDVSGDEPRYTILDLAQQNAGSENPLDRPLTGNPNQAMLANLEACFVDAASITNAFVCPNEVYLANGNRTDVFFQAPRLPEGGTFEVYTVLAREVVIHSDSYQNTLQGSYTNPTLADPGQDIVVAWIVVAEDTAPNGELVASIPDFDVMSLVDVLPPVQPYHLPIGDEEVQVAADAPDAAISGREGSYRTRTITYSGWGSGDFPLVTSAGDSDTARNFREFVTHDQETGGALELLRYARIPDSDDYVLLAPNTRTMAIAGSTSDTVIDDTHAGFPITARIGRKFSPDDPQRPRLLQDTAEEWAVYNYSISLWADTAQQPAGQSGGHYPGQPLLRAEGQSRFAAQPADAKTWRLQTKGVDHPFHIHQNPCWVMRVEVPDEHGNLVNILPQPRWQDVIWIPRNGGRVVFRSRFPDYIGVFVNHCHILLHEDHGMMQAVEITPFADEANYEPKDSVASVGATPEAVSAIYPRLDQAQAWRQSMQFVDPNHVTGQVYPGFDPGQPPTE